MASLAIPSLKAASVIQLSTQGPICRSEPVLDPPEPRHRTIPRMGHPPGCHGVPAIKSHLGDSEPDAVGRIHSDGYSPTATTHGRWRNVQWAPSSIPKGDDSSGPHPLRALPVFALQTARSRIDTEPQLGIRVPHLTAVSSVSCRPAERCPRDQATGVPSVEDPSGYGTIWWAAPSEDDDAVFGFTGNPRFYRRRVV